MPVATAATYMKQNKLNLFYSEFININNLIIFTNNIIGAVESQRLWYVKVPGNSTVFTVGWNRAL
jgi:hypothetical protein